MDWINFTPTASLAGYCPGPALASVAAGGTGPLVFALSLAAGMALFELFERLPRSRSRHAT